MLDTDDIRYSFWLEKELEKTSSGLQGTFRADAKAATMPTKSERRRTQSGG